MATAQPRTDEKKARDTLKPPESDQLEPTKPQGASWKIRLTMSPLVTLFEQESNCVLKDSEEGRRLMSMPENVATNTRAKTEDLKKKKEVKGEAEEGGEKDRPNFFVFKAYRDNQQRGNDVYLINKATQTLNIPSKDTGCQINPPPRKTFSATANQWPIHDAYREELQRQEEQKATQSESENDKSKMKLLVAKTKSCELSAVAKSAQILGQVIHQNIYDEIFQDFQYFDDPSDKFRGQQGTLLPLWVFTFEEAKELTVTALCWINKHPDIFAVGMGLQNVYEQRGGMIALYTLKNSLSPKYFYPTTSGVQSVDIHQQHVNLVAVGFSDGCVAVYDLKKKSLTPVCKGTPNTNLRTNPVWQVRWQNDDIDDNHNFISVAADSRVVSWTMIENELISTELIRLPVKDVPDDKIVLNIPGGTTLNFHKQIDHLFLVGTNEGQIHKCSKPKDDLCKVLETYDAHGMAVGTVEWNHFHPAVFISCSFDFTVKIWKDTIKVPLLTFNLESKVGDVAWAPYSSTVFAAVTVDGIVHVFDLNVNKYKAICQQVVVTRTKTWLTRVEFNPVHPVIIVGNNQGVVGSFKLSPNLRKKPKDIWGQGTSDPEMAKMDQILKCLMENE